MKECELCGCTESSPCVDADTGETCGWVAENLCTFCARLQAEMHDGDEPLVRVYGEHEAQRLIEASRETR